MTDNKACLHEMFLEFRALSVCFHNFHQQKYQKTSQTITQLTGQKQELANVT